MANISVCESNKTSILLHGYFPFTIFRKIVLFPSFTVQSGATDTFCIRYRRTKLFFFLCVLYNVFTGSRY